MVRWLDSVAAGARLGGRRGAGVLPRRRRGLERRPAAASLLDGSRQHGLPLDLAVIPKALGPRLARELRARAGERLALHQHGLRARQPRAGRAQARVRAEPLARRAAAPTSRRAGSCSPSGSAGWCSRSSRRPWNRCTAETGECLAELGFSGAVTRVARRAARGAGAARAAGADRLRRGSGRRSWPAGSPPPSSERRAGRRDVPSRGDGRRRDGAGRGAAGAAGRGTRAWWRGR